jgi:4-oxalocrotonate tautomerase family enzyme
VLCEEVLRVHGSLRFTRLARLLARFVPPSPERMVMPVIQCDIREGRTEEQKQELAKEITRVVHETIGSPVEYIYVLIRETPGAHHVKAGEALEDYEPESIT